MADTAQNVDCLRRAIAAKVAFPSPQTAPQRAKKSARRVSLGAIVDRLRNSAAFIPLEQAAKNDAPSPRAHNVNPAILNHLRS